MKRKLVLLLIIALTLIGFTACGGGSDDAADNAGAESNGEADADVDADAGAEEPIVIQLAHVEPEDRSLHEGSVLFKEYVEEKSGGKLSVNILPNGQYGGDLQAVEGTILGTIQMTAAASSVLTSYSNDFMILDLPFMFDSREASYHALDGELGEALNATLPDGLIGLGFNDNGLRQITNSKRPITAPDDLKGIKMRVMESPVYISMFELLGANPTPMSFTEVYTGLQQGTIDGQENGAGLIYASKFQEVQKYLSLTGHVYSVNAIVINQPFYESLPEDLRQIIADGVKEGLVDGQRAIEGSGDEKFIGLLQEAGMEVNEISPENMLKFRETVSPMYEEYKGSTIREELFDMIAESNEAAK
ncbi:MAG: DctP family TRAP transporter solute-binding subunit [Clostridiales Family XIII bacterium]|jgi:tripartite ATP-independent transporter DctP family solute receptor|nr:DctP family TRAP transporter solute-binding subunit [Clostridiales Family XIII bacterium]